MALEDDIAFLQRIPLLARLGAGALRILAIGIETHTVEAGDQLFVAGESADCAYVIKSGSLVLKSRRAADQEDIVGPGSLVGETALLTETTRSATAIAREDSQVLRISRAMFLKTLDTYPDGAQRLRDLMAARAERVAREVEGVRAILTRGSRPR